MIALGVATVALAACGAASSGPTATPLQTALQTPNPTPTPSANLPAYVPCSTQAPSTSAEPTDSGTTGACEVAQILLTPSGSVCKPTASGQKYAQACPVTDDLGAALDRQPLSGPGGGADPICRCQSTWMSATYMVTPTPVQQTQYTVKVMLVYGPGSTQTFDVVVLSVESGSLASDLLCGTGDPSTSIKGSSPGSCS